MAKEKVNGKEFLGNEISKYGLENGRVDYEALSKSFDKVLCNDILSIDEFSWDLVNGVDFDIDYDDEDDEEPKEILQSYIIPEKGYEILSEYTDEIVYYSLELDIYVWGVTFYGTSWETTLTDIEVVN